MARSEKRLKMRRDRRKKQELRRRQEFERLESAKENSSIQNSFARLESRRRTERRLLRQAIVKFFVMLGGIICACYIVAKMIADKIWAREWSLAFLYYKKSEGFQTTTFTSLYKALNAFSTNKILHGAGYGIRTHDPLDHNQML